MIAETILKGNDIKYSLVYIDHTDCLKILEKKCHEIVGYTNMEDNGYMFYSVEDHYSQPISNHWTEDIVKGYDTHTCWVLIKTHPCDLHRIMTNVLPTNNYVYEVNNFDVWKTDAKDCLIAVVTDIFVD